MKITKQKLAEIIKEEIASAISEEDAYEIGAPDEAGETVVDMTGREYTCLLYTSPSPRDRG